MNDLIQCPVCGFASFLGAACRSCGFEIENVDNIFDLRTDKSFDTLLDLDSYDEGHGIVKQVNSALCDVYCRLLEKDGLTPQGTLLEIACGSGLLTASILASGRFKTVHCGDISHGFMTKMVHRIAQVETSTKVEKYLFDANNLPFKDQSFDFVFGNSVLHHFATFENTVRDVFRVLKPGGAAVFAEPIFDSHSFMSLAAGLIVRSPDAKTSRGLTPRHLAALSILKDRAGQKMRNLKSDRTGLRNIEDKFQFPVMFLRELGARNGFSKVIFSDNDGSFKLGEAAKSGIIRAFRQIGLATEPLDVFQHVFDALTGDYGGPMQDYIPPVFAQIAFIR